MVVVLNCRKLPFMASIQALATRPGRMSLLYIPMTSKLVRKLMVASSDLLLVLHIDLRLEITEYRCIS